MKCQPELNTDLCTLAILCIKYVRFHVRHVFYICSRQSQMENGLHSDQQIIGWVVEGKAEMFGELIKRYQLPVYRLAFRLLPNHADAEDAAQEAFIRAFQKLSTYTDSGQFWGWIRRITVNICLRKAASAKPVCLDYIDEEVFETIDICESVICSEEADELRRVISELPQAYLSVVVLKYLEDMSYAEIAEILDESISNIQVRLYRAKKMLRERMKVCANELQ